MDILEGGRSDFGQEPDMVDILNADMFGSPCGLPTTDSYMDNDWLNSLFEDPVLNDKMITEAVQPPRIQSEHSYSINNDPISIAALDLPKLEDFADEMETEFFSTTSPLDLSQKTPAEQISVTIKQELSFEQEQAYEEFIVQQLPSSSHISIEHRPPTIVLATSSNSILHPKSERIMLPKSIKAEPVDIDQIDLALDMLPPTPPSSGSSTSSDSEGSLSPGRSAPSSPIREPHCSKSHSLSKVYSQPLFTSPIPTSGALMLSEEEKRTLITEGYPIPNKLPLTKQEEKNLKKIRRKIKNKISAQESRRKKKEYLETLEKRVETYTQENGDLKRKVGSLENNNRSLLGQLQKLQAIVGKITRPSATTTQTGTVLMVVVLCFAIFVGGWAPMSMNIGYSSVSSAGVHSALFTNPRPVHPSPTMGPVPQNVRLMEEYSTPNKKSRVLLSLKDDLEDIVGPRVPDSGWRCDQESTGAVLEADPAMLSVTKEQETMTTAPVITLDPRVISENQTEEERERQALMHPDISAPADFLSSERVANATAVNESA